MTKSSWAFDWSWIAVQLLNLKRILKVSLLLTPLWCILIYVGLQHVPYYVYYETFGQVHEGVTPHKGYRACYIFRGHIYLSFKAPEDVINRIIKEYEFSESNRHTVDTYYWFKFNPPSWWEMSKKSNGRIYKSQPFKAQSYFDANFAILIYDASNGEAWLEFHGAD